MNTDGRHRVLFLCTGNSCRSQMAEGLTRHRWASTIDACSAGTEPHGLNPLAIEAMAEINIDISGHSSKTLDACDPATLDLVITVCGHAHESCPVFPGSVPVHHQPFDDPPHLAKNAVDHDTAMIAYRRVRDEIAEFVESLPRLLRSA